MSNTSYDDKLYSILAFLHDPTFVAFELNQEAPTVFNAVGRTFTETWHSALLGWLLDPMGSHQLGLFPITRFLLLLKAQDTLSAQDRRIDFNQLLSQGDFTRTRVRPNERELAEVAVVDVGRFDIFVDGIDLLPWKEVQLLVETKVKDKVNKNQCSKYITYINKRAQDSVLIIPIFIAPAKQLIGTPSQLFGDNSWIAVDYQDICDEVIELCLQHPSISTFGQFTLSEYIKTLKYRQKGGEPLAITQQERDMVNALWEKHEVAIRALYEILSQSNDDVAPLTTVGGQAQNSIKIKIGNKVFDEPSVTKLYDQVLQFLVDGNHLSNLQLPVATGAKRYLIADQPAHQRGNEFIKPVGYKGFYMEANKSRDDALRDLSQLLAMCGLALQHMAGSDA